ncbi:MAG: hypothetical protein AB1489_09930 [Acidobacteriota bacterium]
MPTRQVFRCSFWYLWSRLGLLGGGLVIASTSISFFAGGLFSTDYLTLTLLIGSGNLIFSALSVWAHVRYFPIIVDEEGIRGHTGTLRGRPGRIAWADIYRVQTIRHFGLPCYRITAHQGGVALLVPMYLKQRADFENELFKQGIQLNSSEKAVAPSPRVRRQRGERVTMREGGYIVISTEQRHSKNR